MINGKADNGTLLYYECVFESGPGVQPSASFSVVTHETLSGNASEHGNSGDTHEWLHRNDVFMSGLLRGTVSQGMCHAVYNRAKLELFLIS